MPASLFTANEASITHIFSFFFSNTRSTAFLEFDNAELDNGINKASEMSIQNIEMHFLSLV